MKIDIPFEIGDPVLVIEYNQHDGYYINCRPFRWNDIPNINTNIFKTRKDAEKALKERKSDFIGSANDVSTAFVRG